MNGKMGNEIEEKFDAIVVGAGPAGCTAALALARSGLNVALFERAEEPGQKNMFGGVFHHSRELNELIPNYWEQAPVERYVNKYITTLLAPDSTISFLFNDDSFARPPYNGFTVLRAKFDQWYSQKAEEAGAFLITDTAVDDLLWDGNQVIGIETRRENGRVYADTVILADGVNSLLAKEAGLRKDFRSSDFSVAAKEVLSLPPQVIEERFDLAGNEGLAHLFLGTCTQGLEGGAFLYTNKSSLSIGVVGKLSALQERKISIADLVDGFKSIPCIQSAVKDATLKEYSGHLIPEGGIRATPQLYGNGVLVAGDAAGFVCATGLTLQGMDFAISSGFMAAEAVKLAKQRGDFSKRGLACYRELLEKNSVLKDLTTFHHAPVFLSNPRLYELYPTIACGVARRLYKVDGEPRKKIMGLLRAELKGRVSIWQAIKDMIQAGRTLIWP